MNRTPTKNRRGYLLHKNQTIWHCCPMTQMNLSRTIRSPHSEYSKNRQTSWQHMGCLTAMWSRRETSRKPSGPQSRSGRRGGEKTDGNGTQTSRTSNPWQVIALADVTGIPRDVYSTTTITSTSQLITIFLKINKFKNKNIRKSNERPIGVGAVLNRSDSEVQVHLDLNKKEKGFIKL